MSQDQAPIPLPTQIGKYKIEGLISHGGMSLLYVATDPETQNTVIIKVLLPKFLSEKDVVARFLNEARIISLADHPNIVRLLDSGEWEGGLYIAMEFVKGTSLRKVFQHQPYSLKRAIEALLQIAYAVSHLHSHGVVHGDLKPENILINEHGQVKVIDFGIAQVLADQTQEAPRRFLGTPIYMSPELGVDRHNLSFQSDMYALGIIAYELAIGKLSHGRIIISLAPVGLQKILSKALQPRPIDRYSDMCDFIADITNYYRSQALEKDKQGSDYLLETFETLENIQKNLIPQDVPLWPQLKMDFAYEHEMGISGLYIDFFDIDDETKLIFAAASNKKGAEALIDTCKLQAALHTLLATNKTLDEEALYKHVGKDISFAYVLLHTRQKKFTYSQKNYGIFFVNSLPIQEKQGSYQTQDTLIFIGIKHEYLKDLVLEDVVKDMPSQSSQLNAEAILRKVRIKTESKLIEQPLSVILLKSA